MISNFMIFQQKQDFFNLNNLILNLRRIDSRTKRYETNFGTINFIQDEVCEEICIRANEKYEEQFLETVVNNFKIIINE